jgi:hypothetical protein
VEGGAVIDAVVGGVFSECAKGDRTAVGKLAGMGAGAALGVGSDVTVSAVTPDPVLTSLRNRNHKVAASTFASSPRTDNVGNHRAELQRRARYKLA